MPHWSLCLCSSTTYSHALSLTTMSKLCWCKVVFIGVLEDIIAWIHVHRHYYLIIDYLLTLFNLVQFSGGIQLCLVRVKILLAWSIEIVSLIKDFWGVWLFNSRWIWANVVRVLAWEDRCVTIEPDWLHQLHRIVAILIISHDSIPFLHQFLHAHH